MQLILRQESHCTWEPHSNQRWRDAICLSPMFHDEIFMMTFMTEALPIWKRSCTRNHGSCLSTHFFSKKEKCKKRVIYSLVADVPVSPVWCVFATSVCQPKCVPARVQQQRSVLLCASAGFTLSQRSISPQTINTLLIVFSPHLLCPYITPKTPVMRCCKDREKKKKRRMGVIAAVKEAFEISPRSFAAAATAMRTILLESGWNRSCLWKRHKSISGSYDEPRHTKQKRGGEG